jgi:hypothetical protein
MYVSKLAACVLACVGLAAAQISISGTVTNQLDEPIEGALVILVTGNIYDRTDAVGYYQLSVNSNQFISVINPLARGVTPPLRVRDGMVTFSLDRDTDVRIEVFDSRGRLVHRAVDGRVFAGTHTTPIVPKSTARGMLYVRATFDGHGVTFPYTNGLDMEIAAEAAIMTAGGLAKAAAAVDSLRGSAAGYLSKTVGTESYNATVDIVLDTLESEKSYSPLEDGSADRMQVAGIEQYFWGDMDDDGQSEAIVMIANAVTEEAVDLAVVFNPGFVDLTYGENVVGWNRHTFASLVGSDHVEIQVRDCNQNTVFFGKLDLITADAEAPSGYASQGPFGGDGEIIEGDASDILSFGTSFDDNLNYYGYADSLTMVSSPPTDSNYTENPDYPYWQYFAIYRITLDPAAFGVDAEGNVCYGDVQMTYVHASPAKTPLETVTVTEGPPPDTLDNPFRNLEWPAPSIDRPDTIPGGVD